MSVHAAKVLDRLIGGAALRMLKPLRALDDMRGRYRTLRDVREIAVVKFWGIGNMALLVPVLHALRRRYPGARLTVVTLKGNEALLRGAADRVLTVRMRPMSRAAFDVFRAAAVLRRHRVDLALDFEQYVRTSQVLLHLAGARQVVAFDTDGLDRAALADVSVPYDNTRHVGQGFLDLARAAGVRAERYEPGGLTVDPEAAARMTAWRRRHRLHDQPLVVLHPGSGDNFPGRRWPSRRFGLLGRALADDGAAVVLTGSPSETTLTREVGEAARRRCFDLAGALSLDELVALLAQADLLVANDTGPVHIASGLGVPVLGLYGPNTPVLYGPLSSGSVSFYEPPPCAPCITNFNYKTSRCLNPVCIQAIGVDAVLLAARDVLAQAGEPATPSARIRGGRGA